ncbi:hypothetical protein TNCT_669081 [Trichonephila clavata]|uniref:Uncharacterized protein n=1 Tax=Trichonephila clavata TaxID=2740835 RepID=A0A8X6KE74_TRICU|nr:hypothetical protein TNCT_669081 [Trichonephila clavata]
MGSVTMVTVSVVLRVQMELIVNVPPLVNKGSLTLMNETGQWSSDERPERILLLKPGVWTVEYRTREREITAFANIDTVRGHHRPP